ncbi:MAG: LPS assembly lipoprotein LptE [bacterium]|nr:LPS assembly lipoprotein LptE [bacterium]
MLRLQNKWTSHRLAWIYTPWLLALLLLSPAGCAGYQLGNRSLYNPNIRTVYIPVVRNDTFRHELGVQLTEAIQKAVELRTPYKVVANPSADSTLTCRITTETKRTVTEAVTDEPRAVEALVTIELTWTDRRGNLLMENQIVPLGELAFYFVEGVDFVPEAGQSMATAQHQAVERLADQIVGQMEVRW